VFNDVPERFQTRKIPVTSADEDELKNEAVWIQQNAFDKLNLISKQVIFSRIPHIYIGYSKDAIGFSLVEQGSANLDEIQRDAPDRIYEVLNFIRNSNYEVPFIAFYRKEHVDGVLGIQDLWSIFEYDEKVCIELFSGLIAFLVDSFSRQEETTY
jgi:transcription elongation factor SPT6